MPKIYTKTGDKGTTGLVGGKRVSKNSPRLEAYGTVDELNCLIGLTRSIFHEDALLDNVDSQLEKIQNELFDLGSRLACDEEKTLAMLPEISENQVRFLEKSIDEMTALLKPLKNFILPGGDRRASVLHLARTVCRRAERQTLKMEKPPEEILVVYLNRLSDYLFVAARYVNHIAGKEESIWSPRKKA